MRIPLAIAFAMFATVAQAADACVPVRLTCRGSEPFWRFVLSGTTLSFTDPENPNGGTPPLVLQACAHPHGQGYEISAGAPLDLSATVKHQQCTEPSGKSRPYTISISYKQGASGGTPMQVQGTGCCWK